MSDRVIRMSWTVCAETLLYGLAAVLAALPIALLWAPTPWSLFAWAYTISWAAMILYSSGPLLYMCLDAGLILVGRRPLLLPRILEARARNPDHVRRIELGLTRLMRWSIAINPLSNLAISMMVSAGRRHPEHFAELRHSPAATDHSDADPPFFPPTTEGTKPILRIVRRELSYC